jgi:hypothetical protein
MSAALEDLLMGDTSTERGGVGLRAGAGTYPPNPMSLASRLLTEMR